MNGRRLRAPPLALSGNIAPLASKRPEELTSEEILALLGVQLAQRLSRSFLLPDALLHRDLIQPD